VGKIKRLIVIVVILTVIVVMALRGCPRARRSAGIARNSTTAFVPGISRTIKQSEEKRGPTSAPWKSDMLVENILKAYRPRSSLKTYSADAA